MELTAIHIANNEVFICVNTREEAQRFQVCAKYFGGDVVQELEEIALSECEIDLDDCGVNDGICGDINEKSSVNFDDFIKACKAQGVSFN
jgi:hypothetical protein